ncbi:hypothetical protein H0A61_00193 [Koleobacter methoxysyntrophicus]|uniref:DUF2922 domain-containing protein n=1 Tax=Koleobacter methoxysyntrophicus TaxID=2751313 RepID=A0A8A0RKW4_9FIRM|nr:DUF2922 domain-containing protein [Koleobacter methoxysyntrophicus]QSQ07876.1 hypothetical protein H0A61_00193 [Koleobacter methoxysyntrophicus]
MNTTLEMNFINASGKNSRITLNDPRADLTATEVEQVMDRIILANIFNTPGGDLTQIGSARIVTRDVIELL